jgi:hypothetical protein
MAVTVMATRNVGTVMRRQDRAPASSHVLGSPLIEWDIVMPRIFAATGVNRAEQMEFSDEARADP